MSQQKKSDQPSAPAHWIYMAAVLGGGLVLNLALIALLGSSAG